MANFLPFLQSACLNHCTYMFCLPKAWYGDSSLDCSGRGKAEHTVDQGQHGSVSCALDNSCNPYVFVFSFLD